MMKWILSACAAVSFAACGGTSIQTPAQGGNNGARGLELAGPLNGPGVNGRPEVSPRDEDFAGLINGIRRGDGSGVVSYNAKLNRAAQGHADDMLAQNYFSHTSKDGRVLADRIAATGYKPVAFGENIAQGFTTNKQVMNAWQNSPSHNRLLMADTVDEFGLGVAGSGASSRWVLVMAAD